MTTTQTLPVKAPRIPKSVPLSALAGLLVTWGHKPEDAARLVQEAQEAAKQAKGTRSHTIEDMAPKRAVTALARLRSFMLARAGGATPAEFATVYGKGAMADVSRLAPDADALAINYGTVLGIVEGAISTGAIAAKTVTKKGSERGSAAAKAVMEARGVIATLLDD